MTVSVTVLPKQKISSSGNTTFCNGSFVNLSSSFSGNYLWNNTATTSTIRADKAGNFSFIGTDANGCQAKSDTIKITVNPTPSEIIVNSGPLTFCEGDSVNLSAASGLTYLWSTGETTQTIKVKTSGTYFAELSNQYKCNGLSDNVTVLVNRTPKPTIVVKNVILTSTEATGNQWYLNGTPIQNATSQIYHATSLGSYFVESTNGSCIGTSPSVLITSLSINNTANSSAFKLFPNPNNGIMSFEPNSNSNYKIEIYNVFGQLVYTTEGEGNLEINIMNFDSGNYAVRVNMNNQIYTQNIIKI